MPGDWPYLNSYPTFGSTTTTTTATTNLYPQLYTLPLQAFGLGGTIFGGSGINAPISFGQQASAYPRPPADPNCAHDAWEIQPINLVGQGTCLNCGGHLGIDVLIHALRDRLLEAVNRLEQRLAIGG